MRQSKAVLLEVLEEARLEAGVNLEEINTPKRADVGQLVEAYPYEHTISVLDNLIRIVEAAA